MPKANYNDFNTDSFKSFGDIISNLLGLLVVLVMIMFLTVGMEGKIEEAKTQEEKTTVAYKSAQREFIRPWDEVYIVAFDSLVCLDFEQIINIFLENMHLTRIETPYAKISFLQHVDQRDVDLYQLMIRFDWKAFRALYPPLKPETLSTLFQHEFYETNKKGNSCTFLVYPSGIELFSIIHEFLLENNVKFRWYPRKKNSAAVFSRGPEHFNSESYFLY